MNLAVFYLSLALFAANPILSSLFFSHDKNIVMLILYVDDMVIMGNNSATLDQLLVELNKQLRMKDLGRFHYFLGIQALFVEEGVFLSSYSCHE